MDETFALRTSPHALKFVDSLLLGTVQKIEFDRADDRMSVSAARRSAAKSVVSSRESGLPQAPI